MDTKHKINHVSSLEYDASPSQVLQRYNDFTSPLRWFSEEKLANCSHAAAAAMPQPPAAAKLVCSLGLPSAASPRDSAELGSVGSFCKSSSQCFPSEPSDPSRLVLTLPPSLLLLIDVSQNPRKFRLLNTDWRGASTGTL